MIVTGAFSAVTLVLSVIATWYFAKRHYTKSAEPITDNDLVAQSARHKFYINLLWGSVFLVFMMGMVWNMVFD